MTDEYPPFRLDGGADEPPLPPHRVVAVTSAISSDTRACYRRTNVAPSLTISTTIAIATSTIAMIRAARVTVVLSSWYRA